MKGERNPTHTRASLMVQFAVSNMEKLTSNGNELLQDKWARAAQNPDLPINTYVKTLLDVGVEDRYINKLLSLILNLEVDVSDPHTSSSELSVITGVLSKELLGIDLSKHRAEMDKVKFIPIRINSSGGKHVNPIFYKDNNRDQFFELAELKSRQREQVLSAGNFVEISRQLLEQNNQALEVITKGQLKKIWENNRIDLGSKATIFIRDHKTYAGDIDFYYWGPEAERCSLELSKHLILLGYKVDHRSNLIVEDLMKSGRIENGFLAAYLQMYFYMGKAIEINGDSFTNHYVKEVLPVIDFDLMWKTSHKSLDLATKVVGSVYKQNIHEYPGLKDYPFRLLTIVLMGLSSKHNIPFTLDHNLFIDRLSEHVSNEETNILRNSFYYINQARNLYQLVTERRWEMMTPEIMQEIDRVLSIQSGSSIADMMSILSKTIKSISSTHFGEPEVDDILDLGESKKAATQFIDQSYKKVAERYLQITKL